jgi:hypothetical protein
MAASAAASAPAAEAEASFRDAALPEAHPKRIKAKGNAAIIAILNIQTPLN